MNNKNKKEINTTQGFLSILTYYINSPNISQLQQKLKSHRHQHEPSHPQIWNDFFYHIGLNNIKKYLCLLAGCTVHQQASP